MWPEPYKSHGWNARVKDVLEERFHQLVCGHQISLATAQRRSLSTGLQPIKSILTPTDPISANGVSVSISFAVGGPA